jgi:mRNA interferase MazF
VIEMKRGEIWLVNLGNGDGTSKQAGFRPMIIVSNDMANIHSSVIHAIPVTTKNKNKLPTHLEIGRESGLLTPSIAMAEQLMFVDKDKFVRQVGEVDNVMMSKIEKTIMIQFGIFDKVKELVMQNRKFKERLKYELVRC